MTYGIKNKETGLLFSGFENGLPSWGGSPLVWADKLHAQCQAALFVSLGIPAQRKIMGFPK